MSISVVTESTVDQSAGGSQGKPVRILLVTPVAPWPPHGGAEQRTNLMCRALEKLGQVDVFVVGSNRRLNADGARSQFNCVGAPEPLARGARGLWRLLRPMAPRFVDLAATAFGRRKVDYVPDPSVASAMREVLAAGQYDLIVSRYLRPAAKAGLIGRHPLIVDLDDIDTDIYRTRLAKPGMNTVARMVLRSHLRQTERVLAELLPQIDGLIVAKHDDAEAMAHPNVQVAPNLPFDIVDQAQGDPQPPERDSRVVLFVGGAGHRVNRDGVERFARRCWPAIRRAVPDAVFRIVGPGNWEQRRARWGACDGIEVVGFVDELASAYRECAFTVTPLFEGGGTKIKVLESLFYGRAPLVSGHAGRGYERIARDGGMRVAQTESDLIDEAIQMLGSSNTCEQMAAIGHRIVVREFGFGRFEAAVCKTVEAAMKRPQTPSEGHAA